MIDQIKIDYDGPDGTWLVIDDGDVFEWTAALGQGTSRRFRLTDEALFALDKEMQPWRDHMAEGAAIGREFAAHAATGACTHWVAGSGPCGLRAGHDGDCLPMGGC